MTRLHCLNLGFLLCKTGAVKLLMSENSCKMVNESRAHSLFSGAWKHLLKINTI